MLKSVVELIDVIGSHDQNMTFLCRYAVNNVEEGRKSDAVWLLLVVISFKIAGFFGLVCPILILLEMTISIAFLNAGLIYIFKEDDALLWERLK